MLIKRTFISAALIGTVVFAVASSGGGDKRKAASTLKPEFRPVRTTNGFTLKAGPQFTGSHIISSERSHNFVMYNTIVTYEKGNTIYILPYQYKTQPGVNLRSNLSVIDLKIRLHK